MQELAGLLAEPLRAGFSQKYFTGGAAGAAAVLATAAPASIPGAEAPAGGPCHTRSLFCTELPGRLVHFLE